MRTPIHAVPAESSAGHKADRRCACGVKAYRDLNTGQLGTLFVHRRPPVDHELSARERAAQRDFERFSIEDATAYGGPISPGALLPGKSPSHGVRRR